MSNTISSPPPPCNRNFKNRTIFTRDCLEVMRGMADKRIDLIYLDPPFNSNANYAAPVGSEAAGAEFKDTWGLSDIDVAWYGEIADEHPGLYELLTATRSIHGDSMMSYLIYMAIRMMEMKRILKDTGSIYLHCDPTASHYLKLMMDCVFGKKEFQNEIAWCYGGRGMSRKRFQRKHDTILFYGINKNRDFNVSGASRPVDPKYVGRYNQIDEKGKRYADIKNRDGSYSKIYLKDVVREDWWVVPYVRGKESTGYPTQKPVELLQRIIKASSNEGDIVLDPFCGCATACVAAEIEHRQWVGIDVSPKAYELVKSRLKKEVNVGATDDTGDYEPIFGYEVIHRTDIPSDRKGKRSNNIKHLLYGEQEGKCNGCLTHFPFRNMTEDHVVPKSKGGANTDDNIQLLCGACNSKKGHRLTHDELVSILIVEGVRK